ncbi:metal ABC transporter substrate-binding protein [Leucobacter viscericola]|uniref:Metal ABC transporter substrate-binding protein n=1 Tax=Leucobacter viscericola TaxID=2714935 RepID=A0A6G7XBA0_9MICO|nr:metal ABC transporter substrate-binding protein [Leucobacter viscericola]QIK61835.1 metal ABC transporter substrate-binding protein [Leucobacter viscericola]
MNRGQFARRTLASIATVVLAITAAGCSSQGGTGGGAANSGTNSTNSTNSTSSKPVVLTTFTVLADIAKNVAGDHLEVESITKVGAEIHGYEPTPGDIRKAANADLILDNGLHLEAWFERFVADLDVPHVVVSDGVEPIDIAEDTYAGKPNPHAWMSPLNVQIYVDNMVEAFSKLDPKHAHDYATNGKAYKAELQSVQDELVDQLATLPEKQRALVSCEGAFSYLARDAGLTEQYIWAVNAEQQATPKQIAAAIKFVRKNDVPAVFCESTVSDAPVKQVVDATDAKFGGTLYVDSLSEADGPVPTYLDLIRYDSDLIASALTGTELTGTKPTDTKPASTKPTSTKPASTKEDKS